jgi:hypothetical protein
MHDTSRHRRRQKLRHEALRALVSNDFGRTLLAPLEFCDDDDDKKSMPLDCCSCSCCRGLWNGRATPHGCTDDNHVNNNNNNSAALMASTQPTAAVALHTYSDSDDDFSYSSSTSTTSCPCILTPGMMQQIRRQLPLSLQGNKWERCFAIGRDGDSFHTLLEYCADYTFSVIVIRTVQGHILGGFASQPWDNRRGTVRESSTCQFSSSSSSTQNQLHYHHSNSYYGTGESFLFASHADTRTTAPSCERNGVDSFKRSSTDSVRFEEDEKYAGIATSTPNASISQATTLSFFPWSGSNDYCQICDVEKGVLCMGGEGDFGWIVRDNFERGRTGPCRTYANPPLVPPPRAATTTSCTIENLRASADDGAARGLANDGHFEIADFEIYGIVQLRFGFSRGSTSSSSMSSSSSSGRAARSNRSTWSICSERD